MGFAPKRRGRGSGRPMLPGTAVELEAAVAAVEKAILTVCMGLARAVEPAPLPESLQVVPEAVRYLTCRGSKEGLSQALGKGTAG